MRRLLILAIVVFAASSTARADAQKDCVDKSGDEAIAACTQAIRANPRNVQAYYNRGLEYKGKLDYDRAIADYTKAIEINPKYQAAYYNRAVAYLDKGMPDHAIADHIRAIELDPRDADPHIALGRVYGSLGNYDRAIGALNKAISLGSEQSKGLRNTANSSGNKAYARRGYTLFFKGDFKAGAVDLLRAVEISNDGYSVLFRFLARARAGETATDELEANAGRLKYRSWPFAATELLAGRSTPEATLAAVTRSDEICEANFYIGEWHLLRRDTEAAANAFQAATADQCKTVYPEYPAAAAELKRAKP